MNVFIQGMRRSGTTIAFDVFWEDGSFDCYYEPLAAAKKSAFGGGSEEHSVDFFDKIRTCRANFMNQFKKLENSDLLNYGAPRDAELEFKTDLPDYCREYIKFIISRTENTVIKFTRMFCKVGTLWEIDPGAKLIHIVRDPRSVTASYLFGKNQRNKRHFPRERVFFKRKSNRSAWSSYAFSEFILRTPKYAHLRGCEDFARILIMWKYEFRKTHDAGKALFGENYLLLRHEELLSRTDDVLQRVYGFLGQPLPQHLREWAMRHVRNDRAPYAINNANWGKAFKRINMDEELNTAGYAHLSF